MFICTFIFLTFSGFYSLTCGASCYSQSYYHRITVEIDGLTLQQETTLRSYFYLFILLFNHFYSLPHSSSLFHSFILSCFLFFFHFHSFFLNSTCPLLKSVDNLIDVYFSRRALMNFAEQLQWGYSYVGNKETKHALFY